MKVSRVYGREVVEYDSLLEFYNYIMNTPTNDAFSGKTLSSMDVGYKIYKFTHTNTFDEAVNLLKTGWKDMSEKLVQRLKVEVGKMEMVMVSKNVIGVQGYQPIIPLYLNGIPTNMISRKRQSMKQKVITINKSISYPASTSVDQIMEQSAKALAIIKRLEGQGYRCNLNIILGSYNYDYGCVLKIRIKSADERLNVSKLSFPLVHPSMLRRLCFRFMETYPNFTTSFCRGYGTPSGPQELRNFCSGEILLPQFIFRDINKINILEELEKID